MHFHSLDYIVFLSLVVGAYWTLVRLNLLRLLFVFGASCLFYMAWNPAYIALILISVVVDYTAGLGLSRAASRRAKRAWLVASLAANLGLLGVFKYYNFFASAVADGFAVVGFSVTPGHLDVLLPVGISFYTFQTLSYTIDVYRGRLEPTRNFFKFAFFVTFFPQLVAGPIVRAVQLLPQLERPPRLDTRMVGDGLILIIVGMVKKVAVADFLAVHFVDRVFDDPSAYTAVEVLIALYGFTLQIYCDFSGYTDVARGSARLFGLRLPENFDRPYLAVSPADFWRRWHMTLSSWLRDYLYFPLGGSRVSPLRSYWNLWITMFLIGLWHGAAWTFVLYGLLHATVMVLHRYFYRRSGRTRHTVDPTAIRIAKIFGMLHFTVLSRIFFRSSSLENAGEVASQLCSGTFSIGHVPVTVWAVLVVGYLAHFTPRSWFEQIRTLFVRFPAPAQGLALAAVAALLALVATQQTVPYIYFQF
jgi:D-alanyl-lipoteichoic acid acyltransferase DltB (MBOAT superfamily)